jgi:hypothetical protein
LAALLLQLLHFQPLVMRQLAQQQQQWRHQMLLLQTHWGLNSLRFITASRM